VLFRSGQKVLQPLEQIIYDADTTSRFIETLNELERFDGVSIELGGSSVGTGKRGIKLNPNDFDLVYRVSDDVYFNENHPFWQQADAFSNQEGIDVWIVSDAEVSKLEGGSGNFLNRLNSIQSGAKETIKKSIPIDKINRGELIAEAYHKAKADGSNPDLVKAVEKLLASKETTPTQKVDEGQAKPTTESTPTAKTNLGEKESKAKEQAIPSETIDNLIKGEGVYKALKSIPDTKVAEAARVISDKDKMAKIMDILNSDDPRLFELQEKLGFKKIC